MLKNQKDEFIENTNNHLEPYNQRLDSLYKSCNAEHKLVDLGKVNELYPNVMMYRYLLRRKAFFGTKKVLNLTTKKTEDRMVLRLPLLFLRPIFETLLSLLLLFG